MLQYFMIILLLLRVIHTHNESSAYEYIEWVQDQQPEKDQKDNISIPELPSPEDVEKRKLLDISTLKANMSDLSGLLNGVKPYMPNDVHKPIDSFCYMAQLIEDIDNFTKINKQDDLTSEPSIPSMTLYERQKGILEEFKKHVDDNGKKILDDISRLHEAIKQIMDIFQPSVTEATSDKNKMWDAINAVQPLMAEDKQRKISDLVKKLKLFEAINSIDTSADGDQTKEQQMQAILNVMKPLMGKEQQESLDKFMKLAEMISKTQGFDLDEDDVEMAQG